MNFNFQCKKGANLTWFIFLGLIALMPSLNGQHSWEFNPGDFDFNGDINVVVIVNSTEVFSGSLAAFVGEECRGFVDSTLNLTGTDYFSLRCFSNQVGGEILTFRYYDDQADKYYSIEETQEFDSDMRIGSALEPVQFHTVSNAAPIVNCPVFPIVTSHPGPLDFDLCEIFVDPDGDVLTYEVTIDPGGSSYDSLSACEIRFNAAASGTSTLTISASDGEFSENCSYSFTVDASNEAPVIENPINVLKQKENFVSFEIDLDTIFTDPDGDIMSFMADSDDENIVTVSISSSKMTIHEFNPGNAEITVTADDGTHATELLFKVIVVSSGPALPWDYNPGDFDYTGEIDAVVHVNSVELTSGVLGAFVGSECRGIVEGILFPPTGRTLFYLMCGSKQISGELLTFKYYNPIDSIVYDVEEHQEFKSNMIVGNAFSPVIFNIFSDNSVPIIDNPIADQELDEHFELLELNLGSVFSDPDGDGLSYSVVISDTSVAKVSLDGASLKITENKPGTADITVSASDGALTIDDRFNILVNDMNDPPMIVDPIDDIELIEGFRSVAVDISGVFMDPDGDALSYSSGILGSGVVIVYVDESNLIIREVSLGSTNISICGSDGEYQTCQNIGISVIEKNYPPEIDCGAIPDTSFVIGFSSFTIVDLCSEFYDEDVDLLTFTATSSKNSVATVAFNDCDLVVNEIGVGMTTIKFCASDGKLFTCCSFEFSVLEENEIILRYDGAVITEEDSIKICSEASEFTIDVQSDASWDFVTYSDWIQHEIIDNSTLKIVCPENSTGEWRMGLAKVMDDQDHEALFYVYQSKDCVPEYVGNQILNEVIYYPNPVDGVLNIAIDDLSLDPKTEIFIIDIVGRIVMSDNVSTSIGDLIQIDMSGVKSGLYFVRFVDQSGIHFELPVVRK